MHLITGICIYIYVCIHACMKCKKHAAVFHNGDDDEPYIKFRAHLPSAEQIFKFLYTSTQIRNANTRFYDQVAMTSSSYSFGSI